jgi:F-type H+-transporting ATPase subunit b
MRNGLLLSLAIVVGLFAVCFVMSSRASAEAHPKAEGAAVKDEHPKEEKEKDKTGFMGFKRYDLGIYTLLVFGLLIVILGKYAWKPIMDGLQKREDTITTFRAEAEKARIEGEKLLAEIKAQRAKANEDVAAVIAQARRDADAYREAEKGRAAADIQAERDRLKREIETARDQALAEIWEKTVQLATLVSSKAIGREVSADDHRRLIDESLAELNQRIAGSMT